MKPRVAVVLSGYGIVQRGAEAMLEELLPRLSARFDFHVFSRSGKGPGGIARPALPRAAVERLYLASRPGRKLLDTLFLDPLHLEWLSHLLCSLPALVRGRYDVIWHETGLWGGMLLAALRRISDVRLLDIAHSSHPGWELPFARRRPDVFVTASGELAAAARVAAPGLHVEVVPPGVDCELFRPDGTRLPLELPPPIALTVGALSPEKRPELALAAAARAGASAVFAGRGPLSRRLDRMAADELPPDRYRRLELARSELPALYRAADIVTLASPLESGALVLLEAMACGRPVVTSADAVRRELIGDAGLLVEESDPSVFARAITTALDRDWGARPRQRAMLFTVERQAGRMGDILARLAESRR